jgi:hypothetical protein
MANIFTQGPPTIPAPAGTNIDCLDITNNVGYVSTNSGWQPVTTSVAKAVVAAQAANNANVVTYAVPVTGLYEVNYYLVSTNATSGTIPAVSVAFTEALLGTATTAASGTLASSASNTVSTGVLNVYAKAGTNIVVSTTGWASLTYDAVIRIQALG